MNIIHVPRRFVRSHWGGTETVILETCKRLLKLGHETSILCPNALAKEDRELIEGVRVARTPYFYPYLGLKPGAKALLDNKGGNLFSFSLMRALRQAPDLDVIHLHTGKRLGGIARSVAIRRNIPYVMSLHGGVHDVPAEEAKTWTEPTQGAIEWGKLLGWWVGSRRVFDDAAAIICVGEEERIRTQRLYPNKNVVHLPNGVDPERFRSGDGKGFRALNGIPQDAYLIITVGRIDPQKNQALSVRLLEGFLKIQPKTHHLIVGPVTNESYYQDLVESVEGSGQTDRVTIITGLEAGGQALVDAYHSADLFLLPSVHEPFGIVILEAWASGLAVMASRVGGIPSFVEDGEDGLLFESNSGESLMAAFRSLQDAGLRSRLAETGRRKAANHYSWDAITRRLVTLYEDIRNENPVRKS